MKLHLYHGTPFGNFKDFGSLKVPVFFTEQEEVARRYAEGQVIGAGRGQGERSPAVFEVEVDANPFDMRRDQHRKLYEQLVSQVERKDRSDGSLVYPNLDTEGFIGRMTGLPNYSYVLPLWKLVKGHGFDSIWLDEGSQRDSLAHFAPAGKVRVLEKKSLGKPNQMRLPGMSEVFIIEANVTSLAQRYKISVEFADWVNKQDPQNADALISIFLKRYSEVLPLTADDEGPVDPMDEWKSEFLHFMNLVGNFVSSFLTKNPAKKKSIVDLAAKNWRALLKMKQDQMKGAADISGRAKVKYDNGWYWVRLESKEECEKEGSMMQHCGESFGEMYSLRDPQNNSHVTLDVDEHEGFVMQCRGKQNEAPRASYWYQIIDLCKKKGWIIRDSIVVQKAPKLANMVYKAVEGKDMPGLELEAFFGLEESDDDDKKKMGKVIPFRRPTQKMGQKTQVPLDQVFKGKLTPTIHSDEYRKEQYGWTIIRTIRCGSKFSITLSEQQWWRIKQLKDGEPNYFIPDGAKGQWGIHRDGEKFYVINDHGNVAAEGSWDEMMRAFG